MNHFSLKRFILINLLPLKNKKGGFSCKKQKIKTSAAQMSLIENRATMIAFPVDKNQNGAVHYRQEWCRKNKVDMTDVEGWESSLISLSPLEEKEEFSIQVGNNEGYVVNKVVTK